MKDDAGAALGLWGSFKQCASSSIRLGIDTQGDAKGGPSRWRKLSQQPKYIWCVALVLGVTLLVSSFLVNDQMHMSSFLDRVGTSFKVRHQVAEGLPVQGPVECNLPSNGTSSNSTGKVPDEVTRKSCYAQVAEALPRGIITPTTDLQFRSLFEEDEKQVQKAMTKNLLAMAVGIKQKKDVDEIVQKFPLNNFTIMLFHYDGIVDQWQDLTWSNQSIHVVALHQTKWWFAKRFMHPDIVDQYNYIFIWDEDLGVQNFHVGKFDFSSFRLNFCKKIEWAFDKCRRAPNLDTYLEIMESEGLEISQPALDRNSSEIHHGITHRQPRLILHKSILSQGCTKDNKALPCTGYVEIMAPVFSKAAWKCAWHMLQNDLVHGWGIDFKIGYCAQGLRSEKVGVIDAEYVLHKGIASLGGSHANNVHDPRQEVRKKSANEMVAFQQRWAKAASEDPTWVDPYQKYIAAEQWFTMYRPKSAPPQGVKP